MCCLAQSLTYTRHRFLLESSAHEALYVLRVAVLGTAHDIQRARHIAMNNKLTFCKKTQFEFTNVKQSWRHLLSYVIHQFNP